MAPRRLCQEDLDKAVGVIVVDGKKAWVEHYNPNRPLKLIMVVKNGGLNYQLAAAVGLRRQRPYCRNATYRALKRHQRLSTHEWTLVMEHLFVLLRLWTIEMTEHWTPSTFRVGRGKFVAGRSVNRENLRTRVHRWPTHYLRPRALRVTISRRDGYLVRTFKRMDALRIVRQRGPEMVKTLEAAVRAGKWNIIPAKLEEFLPDRNLQVMTFLIHRIDSHYRKLTVQVLRRIGELSPAQARAILRLLHGQHLSKFENRAHRLLRDGTVVQQGGKNGHVRFLYSLSLLEQV